MRAEEIAIVAIELERARVEIILLPALLPDEVHRRSRRVLPAQYDVRVELLHVEGVRHGATTVGRVAVIVPRRARVVHFTPVRERPGAHEWCGVELERE